MIVDADLVVIRRAKRRLDVLYRRLGNWRAVAGARGFENVNSCARYVWAFMTRDIVPSNPVTRRRLFLPVKLPSERRPYVRRRKMDYRVCVGGLSLD